MIFQKSSIRVEKFQASLSLALSVPLDTVVWLVDALSSFKYAKTLTSSD